jgi:glycosyltransferase involved in cell wall biosynthesis
MTKILWIGPAFSIAEALVNPALAPAASRWQQGLFTGLREAGCDVRAIGHCNHRVWPIGPLSVPRSQSSLADVPMTAVAHVNLPGLRLRSTSWSLQAEAAQLARSWGRPDLIASYNAPACAADACQRLAEQFSVPWTPFILDHESPTAGWSNMAAAVGGAAGVVFVSHWAFEHAPFPRKLFLDGGVEAVPPAGYAELAAEESGTILYTGAMHRWGGIGVLLDAFSLVTIPGASLWIVGKGMTWELRKRIDADPRVRYYGAVDERTLDGLMRRAAVLANPRPPSMPGNEMNFPSKLLHYLSYGKRVVTTLTPGVAPEYAGVVTVATEGTPAKFATALTAALALSVSERRGLESRIQAFLVSRLWSTQARRFMEWALPKNRGSRP